MATECKPYILQMENTEEPYVTDERISFLNNTSYPHMNQDVWIR